MTEKPSEFLPSDNGETQDDEGSSVKNRTVDAIIDNGPTAVVIIVSLFGASLGYVAAAGFADGMLCVFELINQVLGNFGVGSTPSGNFATQMEQKFIDCAKSNFFGPLRVISGVIGGLFIGYPLRSTLQDMKEGGLLR